MATTVQVRISREDLRLQLTSDTGTVVRQMNDIGRRVSNQAKINLTTAGRVDEGRLRASIDWATAVNGNRVTTRIGTSVEYARYVHDGTGIYGPKGQPIRPKRAKVLAWEGRNPRTTPKRVRRRGGQPVPTNMVFAYEVKGIPPTPFLVDALESIFPGRVSRR